MTVTVDRIVIVPMDQSVRRSEIGVAQKGERARPAPAQICAVRPRCQPQVPMDTDELLVVLLTGGGLALIGTILGALITQVFAVRIGREARREERRMAVKSFQRDTLVALQDTATKSNDLLVAAIRTLDDPRHTGSDAFAAEETFYSECRRLRMLGTRIRDDELRSAVEDYIDLLDRQRREPRSKIRFESSHIHAEKQLYERAGQLIQTLDAIDDAER